MITDKETNPSKLPMISGGLLLYFAVAIVGLGLTVGTYYSVKQYSLIEHEERFGKPVQRIALALKNSLDAYVVTLKSLNALFTAHPEVTYQEFSDFSKMEANNTAGIKALEWVQKVPHSQKQLYIDEARSNGFLEFDIREFGKDGSFIPAQYRENYYPVFFVEPLLGNGRALGFDMGSNPERLQALETARDTGQEIASSKITLVQEVDKQSGVLLFLPSYQNLPAIASVRDRREKLSGFTLGVFVINDIFENIKSRVVIPEGLNIYLVDKDNIKDPYLYVSLNGEKLDEDEIKTPNELINDIHYAEDILFGNRTWRMIVMSEPGLVSNVNRYAPSISALLCLLITILLLSFIRYQRQMRYETDKKVIQRTKELADSRLEAATARVQLIDAIEAIPDAFALYDNKDRLVIFNQNYRNLFEKSKDAIVIGNRYEDILKFGLNKGQYQAVLDGVPADKWLKERMKIHLNGNTEIEQQLSSGEWIRVVERKTADGGLAGFRVNITELKEKEARLEQTLAGQKRSNKILEKQKQQLSILAKDLKLARDEAQQSSNIKSEFLATMSHEIRTPMNGVLGMAHLLLQTDLNKEQKKFAEIIRTSGDALLSIIDDILDFSKLESGQLEAKPNNFELQNMTNWVKSILDSKAKENHNSLDFEISDDVPDWIFGDEQKIRQILLNLVGNAVKFTHGGSITVKASYNEKDTSSPILRLDVIDTGIGIADEEISTLFDRFTQADGSTTRKYGGTGLGLAISKQLATLLGGEIYIKSELTKGSHFWLTVPIQKGNPHAASSSDFNELSVQYFKRPLNILVAEDHPTNQILIMAMLEKEGHHVSLVNNGAEAFEIVQKNRFDVILMDIQMPILDGIDATKSIRGLSGLIARIPIIAVTANVLNEHKKIYSDIGMNGFVAKPVNAKKLALALKSVCRSLCTDYVKEADDNSEFVMFEQQVGVDEDHAHTIIIDTKIIDNMIQSTSKEIAETLIASFPEECEKQLGLLQEAHNHKDYIKFKTIAHTLKGVAASFGATNLSTLAKEAEMIDEENISDLVAEIEISVFKTRSWLIENGYKVE